MMDSASSVNSDVWSVKTKIFARKLLKEGISSKTFSDFPLEWLEIASLPAELARVLKNSVFHV